MSPQKMVAEIEKRMAAIARERDRLDNAISDLDGLRDSCERAYEALETAREALSELV